MRLPASAFLLCFSACVHAQTFSTTPCNDDQHWGGSDVRFCELRSATLPFTRGQVNVLGKNGGIQVFGEDRNDIALEAEVITQASTRELAQSIAREISITTDSSIQARGPADRTATGR